MPKDTTTPEKIELAQMKDLQKRAEALPGATGQVYTEDMSRGELIAFLSFMAAGAAAVGGSLWAAVRQEKKLEKQARERIAEEKRIEEEREAERKRLRAELEEWITEMENSNKKVYRLSDGRYLVVDFQAEQSIHVKKTS